MPISQLVRPSASPFLKQQVAIADANIDRMRKAGMAQYADAYEQGIKETLMRATGDNERDAPLQQYLMSSLKELSSMASKIEEPEQEEDASPFVITQENADESISEMLSVLDSSAYKADPAKLKIIAKAVSKGDYDKANKMANLVWQAYSGWEKQGLEEDKEQVPMNDGQILLRGKKTSRLFRPDGTVLTDRPVNTEWFAKSIQELTGGQGQFTGQAVNEDMIPDELGFAPETTTDKRKLAVIQEARMMLKAGKPNDASDLLNSINFQGQFNMPVTPESVAETLGMVMPQDVQPDQVEQAPAQIPLRERIKMRQTQSQPQGNYLVE